MPPSLTRSSATRLDEAGVRLRMLVGRLRLGQLARLEVDVIMALPRPIDAVGPMQAGVEPLRRIRRGELAREHVAHLVEIGARVLLAVEIAALPAPIGPGAGEPVEHLPRGSLGAVSLGLRQRLERGLVGNGAPEERGNGVLLDSSSGARARPPCGNISVQERRPRPGSSPRAPRSPPARTPPNRRGCGSRSWWSRTRSSRKRSPNPWCSADRCAFFPILTDFTGNSPPRTATRPPDFNCLFVSSARRQPAAATACSANSTPPDQAGKSRFSDMLSAGDAARTPTFSGTLAYYDFVTSASTLGGRRSRGTQYLVDEKV